LKLFKAAKFTFLLQISGQQIYDDLYLLLLQHIGFNPSLSWYVVDVDVGVVVVIAVVDVFIITVFSCSFVHLMYLPMLLYLMLFMKLLMSLLLLM